LRATVSHVLVITTFDDVHQGVSISSHTRSRGSPSGRPNVSDLNKKQTRKE
jgi:hypothetical protein